MACCAFAAFLLLNLLIPIGLARRSATSEKQNPAVTWRYQDGDQATVGVPVAGKRIPRPATAVFAIYLACVAVLSIYWLNSGPASNGTAMSDAQWDAFAALNAAWCRGGSSDTRNNTFKGTAQ